MAGSVQTGQVALRVASVNTAVTLWGSMWRASGCSPSIDGKRPSGNKGNSLKVCSYFIYVKRRTMFHFTCGKASRLHRKWRRASNTWRGILGWYTHCGYPPPVLDEKDQQL